MRYFGLFVGLLLGMLIWCGVWGFIVYALDLPVAVAFIGGLIWGAPYGVFAGTFALRVTDGAS